MIKLLKHGYLGGMLQARYNSFQWGKGWVKMAEVVWVWCVTKETLHKILLNNIISHVEYKGKDTSPEPLYGDCCTFFVEEMLHQFLSIEKSSKQGGVQYIYYLLTISTFLPSQNMQWWGFNRNNILGKAPPEIAEHIAILPCRTRCLLA